MLILYSAKIWALTVEKLISPPTIDRSNQLVSYWAGRCPGCVKTPITKLLTQCYVKCEGDSLENEVRFEFEAHVLLIFGANNALEIVFTQPVPEAAIPYF